MIEELLQRIKALENERDNTVMQANQRIAFLNGGIDELRRIVKQLANVPTQADPPALPAEDGSDGTQEQYPENP